MACAKVWVFAPQIICRCIVCCCRLGGSFAYIDLGRILVCNGTISLVCLGLMAFGIGQLGGWCLWCLVGVSHRMADFFAMALATEAPGSFTGGGLVAQLLDDVVLLVVMLIGGGGMKHLGMSGSRPSS